MAYTNKEDQKAFHAGWYKRNRDRIIAKSKISNRKYRKEIAEWLDEIKVTTGCSKCSENRAPCLDFHHRNPADKEYEIGKAILSGWNKERIMKEIEKCDVVCSNCHRLIHAGLVEW